MIAKWIAALILTAGTVQGALAKDQCWDRREGEYPNNMFLNMVMTDQWRDLSGRADSQAMRGMVGVWYGEISAPSLGMVDRQYRSFEANGLFQYKSQTCGNIAGIPCSENYGTGQWVAVFADNNGAVQVMMHFDDMTQSDRCGGFVARLQGNLMLAGDGSRWQRVQ
jgi:hypothetical protein